MVKMIMYQCELCKKYFKTPNRHQCKYDPNFKNCFSCKHNKGFNEEIEEGYHSNWTTVNVDCALNMSDADVKNTPKNMQCSSYEYCGGKWNENEYVNKKESFGWD